MFDPINISPEQKKRLEIEIKAGKIYRENLRRRLEIRFDKAKEKDDQKLLSQLQQELENHR